MDLKITGFKKKCSKLLKRIMRLDQRGEALGTHVILVPLYRRVRLRTIRARVMLLTLYREVQLRTVRERVILLTLYRDVRQRTLRARVIFLTLYRRVLERSVSTKYVSLSSLTRALTPSALATLNAALTPASVTTTESRVELFRSEALDFQRDMRQWGQITTLNTPSNTLVIWIFIGIVFMLFVFLLMAPYSRKETVRGYLKPPSGTARVLAMQAGTVTTLHVKEGDVIAFDQPLISIASPQVDKDGTDVNFSIINVLQKQKYTIQEQIAAEEVRNQIERKRLEDLISGLTLEVSHFQAQLEAQKERIKISEELVATANVLKGQGYISAKELGDRKIGLLDHQLSIEALTQQMIARQNEIIEKKATLEQLPVVTGERLRQLNADLSATEQKMSEVKGRSAYILRAPIAGRVSSLPATTGQPAEPGRLLLTIVPEGDPLEAELFVPTRAAGFVKAGQRVRILYDAFPYQNFGTHGGNVAKMSQTMLTKADVTGPIVLDEPAYRVTAKLDRTDIETSDGLISLQPDMLLKADIILDRRPLLTWIFNPVVEAGRRQTVQ